jgi:hypothetical protein
LQKKGDTYFNGIGPQKCDIDFRCKNDKECELRNDSAKWYCDKRDSSGKTVTKGNCALIKDMDKIKCTKNKDCPTENCDTNTKKCLPISNESNIMNDNTPICKDDSSCESGKCITWDNYGFHQSYGENHDKNTDIYNYLIGRCNNCSEGEVYVKQPDGSFICSPKVKNGTCKDDVECDDYMECDKNDTKKCKDVVINDTKCEFNKHVWDKENKKCIVPKSQKDCNKAWDPKIYDDKTKKCSRYAINDTECKSIGKTYFYNDNYFRTYIGPDINGKGQIITTPQKCEFTLKCKNDNDCSDLDNINGYCELGDTDAQGYGMCRTKPWNKMKCSKNEDCPTKNCDIPKQKCLKISKDSRIINSETKKPFDVNPICGKNDMCESGKCIDNTYSLFQKYGVPQELRKQYTPLLGRCDNCPEGEVYIKQPDGTFKCSRIKKYDEECTDSLQCKNFMECVNIDGEKKCRVINDSENKFWNWYCRENTKNEAGYGQYSYNKMSSGTNIYANEPGVNQCDESDQERNDRLKIQKKKCATKVGMLHVLDIYPNTPTYDSWVKCLNDNNLKLNNDHDSKKNLMKTYDAGPFNTKYTYDDA